MKGWGKVSTQYVHDQWVCIYFMLKKSVPLHEHVAKKSCDLSSLNVENAVPMLHACIEALNIVPADQALPILQCMRIVVPKVSK